VDFKWKSVSGAGFIMVFQKAGRFALVLQIGVEMVADRSGLLTAQPVIQAFVIQYLR
jgi:hypothetical protein